MNSSSPFCPKTTMVWLTWDVSKQFFKFFLSIKGGFLKYVMQQLKTSVQRFDATSLANFGKSDAQAKAGTRCFDLWAIFAYVYFCMYV